jgi:hypothetical protein
MQRDNCWETKKCGRQADGENAEELGVCPAALPNEFDGVNNGRLGGRFCWAIVGTLCGGEVQGTYSKKFLNCLKCDFLKQVNEDEGQGFILTPQKAISIREARGHL